MIKQCKFILLLLAFTVLAENKAIATHIRAGEITAKRISFTDQKYQFRFVGYRDSGGPVEFGDGLIDFGDGSNPIRIIDLDPNPTIIEFSTINVKMEQWTFVWEYTFSGASAFRIISYREENRNDEILNIPPDTPFYIETKISTFPSLELNQSPIMLIPPVDEGCVDVAFIHNPGVFDPEGDSISYSLKEPQQDKEVVTFNYRFPNDREFYPSDSEYDDEFGNTPAKLTIDPITGDMVWDAPGVTGEFNVAILITEWRKINGQYFEIGFVTRDMQIYINDDCTNERPELEIPRDTCVVAGTELIREIRGTDPDGNQVMLEAFGGVFEFDQNFLNAEFAPTAFQPQPATSTFSWQTDCAHVRKSPYPVYFKVSDDPTKLPSLVDFATWFITVVGPSPELETATVKPGRSIELDWTNYVCAAEAESMQVWRRVDSYEFEPTDCLVGLPEYTGYELITTLPIESSIYLDNNSGAGLDPGANYCYRLVAVFQSTSGESLSYASNEVCAEVLADAPIITNVSIEKTSKIDGEIFVRWATPIGIDPINFPPPFTYDVYRSIGFEEGDNSVAALLSTSDTSFVDNGLNTEDNVYNYKIYMFDNAGDSVDVSAVASSVRLELSAGFESITLAWSANTPWSNNIQDYPRHYVYRDIIFPNFPDSLVLIDSVDVTKAGFVYVDDGSHNDEPLLDEIEYCYYITAFGSYGNDDIIAPLINDSQIICAQPNDTIPPCMPLGFEVSPPNGGDCESIACQNGLYSNTLSWSVNALDTCGNDIRNFNIYYSSQGIDGPYEIIATSNDTTFIHADLNSFAGCYKVSSVDRSGNESPISDPFCVENCLYYELPNVFTPDNDPGNFNNSFRPFPCPSFVEKVDFRVYNRHGKQVYNFTSAESENSILIEWDGRNDNGVLLATGVYYYIADVTFIALDPKSRQQKITGWVHILY